MKLLLCGDMAAAEWAVWRAALAAAMPEAEWLDRASALAAADEVQAAVVANPPPGSLQGLPRLRLVQSLWAGVDRLLADPTLPPEVPVARMVDPAMTAAMAETALWATLALHRGFFAYGRRQARGEWRVHAQRRADEIGVLVLGQGEMGRAAAARIAAQGYRVHGWRRDGGALAPLLGRAQVLINLLPLTPATRGLLDAKLFAALPPGAGVVNLGRGAHVVDADLLAALDAGHLGQAVLDVFHQEPLPADHAWWRHPRVALLPHAAALTDPRSAAAVAVANLRALRDGGVLVHRVSRQRGY
ncbi:Glyoxylate/hydroxypyruvate reductase A [Rubrivivax sp. A210]|uniref:NAD(P)-dependent oxidoreductase n=1 Tax=Rubrivivax sp. A210 TaxID=2772301 RepID=UPI00191B7232|nr:NAD(P)-dependent oxidoreductase [Rubrivivax sp. A210]CAD5373158.1 Glyoxylate/hydroxypyruvate reductase A [Rubrivivax sp. A210]